MADQQLELSVSPHRNHQLFSDHYLTQVLPAHWGHLEAEAQPVLAAITRLFDDFHPSDNERQTEDNLVCPILRALGHTFELQSALKTPDGVKVPDYVFYHDADAVNAHKNHVLTDTIPDEGGLAVGDAKYWGRPLDIAIKQKNADALSNKNPAYQIYYYILHSGVAWGILTNGKQWRLYHRDTAHKLDVYYEVDLEELVRSGDVARFLYFYAFFRRAAWEDGPFSLAQLLRASGEYARGVGDSLKGQVYEALRHIAQGFLDYPLNNLTPDAPTLQAIHDNALILLYRLIFILYAEARELLPVRENEMYRDTYSLFAIARAVAKDRDGHKRLLPTSALLWPRLKELFTIIDKGSPPLHVATFNGGLFDPQKHPFLEQYSVGDDHLQAAIDKLARVKGQLVDYRDLAVRHMGTIYEGLLEYRLQPCAPTDGWTVDLLTDKGERKATGSYYTPEYIVKFIVERTVGPVLQEAVVGKTTDADVLHAILTVNVLDPAMGSGHFLVEATEYIARYLVDLGLTQDDTTNEADLAYWKRRVVQSCIYGVDLNPLAVELAKLSLWLITVAKDRPLSFLDHHLRPGNSLVGARLSALQQHSVTAAKSARKKKAAVEDTSGQTALFADTDFTQRMAVAVGSMWMIEENEAVSVAQVKEQERLYADLRRQLIGKYGKLADLLTAQQFGLAVPSDLWKPLVDFALGRTLGVPKAISDLLVQAEAIAAQERFFHWELEFPEIYFDRFGRPLDEDGGFEAVVGNPPYVRQEQLAPYKPYFQAHYQAFNGVADLYLYFYERGLQIARQDARMAYISSGTFARANFAASFRQWLPTVAQMETLIDFGENQPFEGAEMVRPSIVVLRKGAQVDGFRSLFIAEKIPASLDMALLEQGVDCGPAALAQSEWTFQAAGHTRLAQKILHAGRPLSEVVEGRMYRGVLTGLNEAFIIDQATHDRIIATDPTSTVILKPMLRGEDLRPWYQENEGRWLVAIPCGWTRKTFGPGLAEADAWLAFVERHPSVASYLHPFADAGRNRCDKGDYWWELRPCDYYDAFEQPKIFWPDIAKLPRWSWDERGKFINNKGYIIPDADPALFAILQSRVLWFATANICQPLRLRAGLWQYQMFTQFISRLPIPGMTDEERAALAHLAHTITEIARTRYALHEQVRHRLVTDFGTPDKPLNQKLTAWWTLDFAGLRRELQKVFKHDIPVKERNDWESWLTDQRAEHQRLTADIIGHETDLNARVYALFDLTDEEIAVVEESTKYPYGEV